MAGDTKAQTSCGRHSCTAQAKEERARHGPACSAVASPRKTRQEPAGVPFNYGQQLQTVLKNKPKELID